MAPHALLSLPPPLLGPVVAGWMMDVGRSAGVWVGEAGRKREETDHPTHNTNTHVGSQPNQGPEPALYPPPILFITHKRDSECFLPPPWPPPTTQNVLECGRRRRGNGRSAIFRLHQPHPPYPTPTLPSPLPRRPAQAHPSLAHAQAPKAPALAQTCPPPISRRRRIRPHPTSDPPPHPHHTHRGQRKR